MELMNVAFGAKQVQKDQQSHHKAHRAVFAYERDFLVGDAVRSGCVWATYLKLDVGDDGEKLAERESLDRTAAQDSSAKELARIERVRVMIDLICDSSIDEETDDDDAMVNEIESSSADERADRRRKHLQDDSDVPGESLLERRRRQTASSMDDASGASDSALSDATAGDRRGRSAKRRRRTAGGVLLLILRDGRQ